MRRVMVIGAGLVVIVLGAGLFGAIEAVPGRGVATGPATTGAVDVRAERDKVGLLGTVDGVGIDAEKFKALLMTADGARVFGEVVDLKLAEQACEMAGFDTQSRPFYLRADAELWRVRPELAGMDSFKMYQEARSKLNIDNATYTEMQISARRDACLRALAKDRVTVSDKDVSEAYKGEYGERLLGRAFVVRTLQESADIRKSLADGKSIDEVAATHGGRNLIVPMNVDYGDGAGPVQIGVMQKLKDASVHAKEKQLVGPVVQEYSYGEMQVVGDAALQDGRGTYVLFYLEQRVPSRLTEVKFEDVREGLRTKMVDEKQRAWMTNHLAKLRRIGLVTINDPALAAAYAEYRKVQEESRGTMHLGEASSRPAESQK